MWRTSSNGGQIWRRDFDGKWTSGLIEIGDGCFLFAGTTYASQGGAYQVFLSKVEADGDLIYQTVTGGPYYDWSWSFIRAQDGGYVVAGAVTEPDGYGYDMLAIRFAADRGDVAAVGVPSLGTDLQLSNYPNPFNPRTVIRFTTPEPATVNLRVFDFRGRHVRTLINGQLLSEGPQEVVWDGTDNSGHPLAAGAYFSQVVAGPHTETRRMTLLK